MFSDVALFFFTFSGKDSVVLRLLVVTSELACLLLSFSFVLVALSLPSTFSLGTSCWSWIALSVGVLLLAGSSFIGAVSSLAIGCSFWVGACRSNGLTSVTSSFTCSNSGDSSVLKVCIILRSSSLSFLVRLHPFLSIKASALLSLAPRIRIIVSSCRLKSRRNSIFDSSEATSSFNNSSLSCGV